MTACVSWKRRRARQANLHASHTRVCLYIDTHARTHARTHAHAHAHALAGAGHVDLRWRRQASAQDFAVAEALEKEVDELKAELGRLKSDTLAARTAASSPAPRRRARGLSDKFSEDSDGAE